MVRSVSCVIDARTSFFGQWFLKTAIADGGGEGEEKQW